MNIKDVMLALNSNESYYAFSCKIMTVHFFKSPGFKLLHKYTVQIQNLPVPITSFEWASEVVSYNPVLHRVGSNNISIIENIITDLNRLIKLEVFS